MKPELNQPVSFIIGKNCHRENRKFVTFVTFISSDRPGLCIRYAPGLQMRIRFSGNLKTKYHNLSSNAQLRI